MLAPWADKCSPDAILPLVTFEQSLVATLADHGRLSRGQPVLPISVHSPLQDTKGHAIALCKSHPSTPCNIRHGGDEKQDLENANAGQAANVLSIFLARHTGQGL